MLVRTRKILLPFFLGLLFAACGNEDPAEKAVCGNGVVEPGEECDDDSEACDNCRRAPGWHCPEGEECVRVEICDNGVDDDDNGFLDCEDPWCDTHEACVTGCTSQSDCRAADRTVEVCMEGICRVATSYDDEGNVLLGEVGIVNEFDPRRTNTLSIKSYSIHYFHPAIPGNTSEKLSCDTLAELARSASLDPRAFNVIRNSNWDFPNTGNQSYLVRDSGVPATGETGWVVLIRFFTGPRASETRVPTGTMLAFSCLEDFDNPPGGWDESRQVEVQVEPACRNDGDCAEGWECQVAAGLCTFKCDPVCEPGFTCRQLENGEPACLRKCDSLPCEPGYICDETPGWVPACFEL